MTGIKSVISFIIPFLLLLSINHSKAQRSVLPSDFYSLNEGLSDRLIKDIHQNQQGFVWLATSNGLNKFDGYEFTVFDNQWDSPYQLSDIGPAEIHEDKQGNLVLIYPNNLVYFIYSIQRPIKLKRF